MKATAARMMAAPTSIDAVTASLSTTAPSQHGDHRIHVGVGGDDRHRRVLEQPRVSGERYERAEHDEVRHRRKRGSRERRRIGASLLTDRDRDREEQRAAGEHLHRGRRERIARGRHARRRERAEGPRERRAHDRDEADGVYLTTRAARHDEDRDAGEAHQHADGQRGGDAVARDKAKDDDPERHRRHNECGESRWHRPLREHDEAVPTGEQQHAYHRGAPELAALDAQRGAAVARHEPRAEERAGKEEAESC